MDKNNKQIVDEGAVQWYIQNQSVYKKLSAKIENILTEILELESNSYHIITCRPKGIDSFKKKISDEKYDDPINQITDLAGIRIITYVEDEVNSICKIIEKTFDIDKEKSLDKSKELGIDKVGYKSVHYIAKLKADRLKLPEYRIFENKYFEIQIRTILQHAWAEIEHDRNYKFAGKLPDEISRRFKLLAGSLEIADREFNNIAQEIDIISKQVEVGTKEGKLDIQISSTTLNQYIDTKFAKLKESGFSFLYNATSDLFQELEDYGIKNLNDLNKIIPKDFISKIFESESGKDTNLSLIGFIRAILMVNDIDKYFSQSWKNHWNVWSPEGRYRNLFDNYGITWDKLNEKYKVVFDK